MPFTAPLTLGTLLHLPHHQCPHLCSRSGYGIVGTNAYEIAGSQVRIQQIKANSYYYYHHGAGIHGYSHSYCEGPRPCLSPFFIRHANCLDLDLHKLKINEFKYPENKRYIDFLVSPNSPVF